MLAELRVENLAVIEGAEARFGDHLTAITGETGAGKSVLLAALGLCLGERAEPELVRRGAERARASAAFSDPQEPVQQLCHELGVEAGELLVLSRELVPQGRSSARANGSLQPVSALRSLAARLVDIQGQGSMSLWLREPEQRAALDELGGAASARLRAQLADLWTRRQENLAASSRLRELSQRQAGELEQARIDLEELDGAQLRVGEEGELKLERERLANATRLLQAAGEVHLALAGDEGESGTADALARGLKGARLALGVDPQLDRLLDQAEASLAALQELQLELSSYLAGLPDDRTRLTQVEERLELIARLSRRHGGSVEAALGRREEAEQLLRAVDLGSGELERLEREREELEGASAGASAALSQERSRAGAKLAADVTEDLRRMLMPSSNFRVRIWQEEATDGVADARGRHLQLGPEGWDRVGFELSANRGDPFRALSEVASGGELSRVALALLSHLAKESGVATVVFDEIDQGLGGEAANRVGELLRDVADRHQVICVTHLAPIAARAETHLVVVKSERDGRPYSSVRRVVGQERVEEVARLLAGEATPEVARAHARGLLEAVGAAAGEP